MPVLYLKYSEDDDVPVREFEIEHRVLANMFEGLNAKYISDTYEGCGDRPVRVRIRIGEEAHGMFPRSGCYEYSTLTLIDARSLLRRMQRSL